MTPLTGQPAIEDYVNQMPFQFTGVLNKVVITLGKSGLTVSDGAQLEKANNKLAAARD